MRPVNGPPRAAERSTVPRPHTGAMRVYIPATVDDLALQTSGQWEPELAFAVTEAWRDAAEDLDEDELADDALRAELAELVAPAEAVFLDAKVEMELIEMEEADALELLQSMGQQESGLHQLARTAFDTLGLQTYLTAGPKEARAWTIRKGATAPEAAGVIHTDFQRGFIKAEVIGFHDLMAAGSTQAARSAGKARMEGKDYVMQDGDVVEFRFNV